MQGKVKLFLCFNAPHHKGVLGEWRYSSTHSLTSALDGSEWSASRPSRFTPRERATGTHWIRGWVGLRIVLDAVVKRKIPSPRRESNPRTLIVQPVAQRYIDWDICMFRKVSFVSWPVNFMKQSSSWEASSRSTGKEIIRFLRKTKVHYRVRKSPPLDSVLSQTNPVYILKP
jgi:hypothetical protein